MQQLHVFVTGGSGFVGRAVVSELLACGHRVSVLSRGRDVAGARTIRADVFDTGHLAEGIAGCDAVIHLVGIIREAPRRGVTFRRLHVEGTSSVLTAARNAGVRRYVHMSALGTRVGAVSEYHRTKWEAEELVRGSALEWTIVRPSMIHGPGGEFMRMAAAWARGTKPPYFFLPYFSPAHRLQPIYVNDVAKVFVDALGRPATVGRTCEVAGPREYAWPEFLRVISRAITGRTKPAVGIPAWYAKLLTRVTPAALLPFNRDQVIMSQEDNTCDLAAFRRDFGWEPAGFEDTLKDYARHL